MKWNISVVGGKETNKDSVSTGEGMRIRPVIYSVTLVEFIVKINPEKV